MQIDCTVTKSYAEFSHEDWWHLEEADARLRVWPADSPWIEPDEFVYPAKQKWFASQTSFTNEPVAPRPRGQLYYHSGLDIGGCEGLTEVVAATDGLVVTLGDDYLPEFHRSNDTPEAMRERYDVVHVLDERGWFYRYSHFHSIDDGVLLGDRVKKGQRLGLIGKEGGSGGWTHLHLEIYSRVPNGAWGTEDGYAFLWQAYLAEHKPELLAIGRPSYVALTDEVVTFDGSSSWSRLGPIASFEWTHPDGSNSSGPTTTGKDSPQPLTFALPREPQERRGCLRSPVPTAWHVHLSAQGDGRPRPGRLRLCPREDLQPHRHRHAAPACAPVVLSDA